MAGGITAWCTVSYRARGCARWILFKKQIYILYRRCRWWFELNISLFNTDDLNLMNSTCGCGECYSFAGSGQLMGKIFQIYVPEEEKSSHMSKVSQRRINILTPDLCRSSYWIWGEHYQANYSLQVIALKRLKSRRSKSRERVALSLCALACVPYLETCFWSCGYRECRQTLPLKSELLLRCKTWASKPFSL